MANCTYEFMGENVKLGIRKTRKEKFYWTKKIRYREKKIFKFVKLSESKKKKVSNVGIASVQIVLNVYPTILNIFIVKRESNSSR